MITESGINLGFIVIYWYAILIVSGAILALVLAIREAKKYGVETETMIDIFFVMMIFGIIGARLYFVIFDWSEYQHDLLSIFNTRKGGLAIYGGLIGGAIAVYFFAKRKNLNFTLIMDIAAPLVLIAQALGRWGNFINQEAYGGIVPGATLVEQYAYLKQFLIPDFIIDGMFIRGNYHHPTFLYESVWNILGFLILFLIIRNYKKLRLGDLSASYFIWYGIGRFMIEGMRTDSLYIFDTIRVSQALSAILVIIGVLLIIFIHYRKNKIPLYQEAKLDANFPFFQKLLDKE